MNYKNGKDFLPVELLEQLQQYIEGEIIYIPKKCTKRAAWGTLNGTRASIRERNTEIFNLYKGGYKIEQIAELYCLSEESIRKIILKIRKSMAVSCEGRKNFEHELKTVRME